MMRLPPATMLAQSESGSNVAGVFGWSLVLIVLVVVGFFGISWLRKWLKSDELPSGGTGFGLSELREMRRRGQITEEEFERARGKIASAAKAVTSRMPDPAGGRRAPGISSPGERPDNPR